MKAFKFIVPPGKHKERVIESDERGVLTVEGRLAIALATSREQALEILERTAAEQGFDTRWLKVADVVELDLETPKRLCWVEQ